MQVVSPSPPRPPNRPSHGHSHTARRISFEVPRSPRTASLCSSSGGTITTTENAMLNLKPGVVDLTESPASSPCSSNPSLSLSPSLITSTTSLGVPPSKGKIPVRLHDRTFPRPLVVSRSAHYDPATTSAPAALPSSSRASSPRKRSTFILPSDAEEFVVPASALRNAVNAGGKVVDVQEAQRDGQEHGWQELGADLGPESQLEQENSEQRAVHHNEEQDAAHGLRRWHALMEIVHTEAGYVRDLRALVKVYFALLPSLSLPAPVHRAVQELSVEASRLLSLHERFLQALEIASARAAGGASPAGSVDEAVKQVAGLFTNEASTFDLYQRFCSAQPDTLRLLRPALQRPEWAAFEQQCATEGDGTIESNMVGRKDDQVSERSEAQDCVVRIVTTSAPAPTSVAMPTRPPTRRTVPRTLSLMPSAFKGYASSSPTPQATRLPPNTRRHSYDSLVGVFGSKLRFHDFLIKPVQRICKYPLMLEGLRSKNHGESADTAVASAVESMRAVAKRVDEARRRTEVAVRSKIILERLEPHVVVSQEFLRSLGDCLLTGSLDVVYHHHVLDPVTTPVRVRYLGAFLYLGGYLLLVKVEKFKYRIKHWFCLTSFDLVDIPEDTALVPCSFRLSYGDHHFEIAAACQREKDLWMRAINEARCIPPTWKHEPMSSLQNLQVNPPVMTPSTDYSAVEAIESPAVLTRGSSSSSIADQANPLAVLRLSTTRSRISTSNPTVRIFSISDGSSILLKRSSGTNRVRVDRGLGEVLSDLVSSMRRQAQAREETLFPPPQFSDGSQTISIAAKNRLMRRGSMLVARPRTLLIPSEITADSEDVARQISTTIRSPHTATTRSRMSLLPALGMLYTEPDSSISSSAGGIDLQLPSTSDRIHSPSGTMSLPSSPTIDNISQVSGSQDANKNGHSHRRARSLVGSVKYLMRRATAKRTQQAPEAWQALLVPDDSSSDTGGSAETSGSSSGRRRVSSAPTSPPMSSATCVLYSGSRSPSVTLDDPASFPPPPISSHLTASAISPTDKRPASVPSSSGDLNHRRSFKSLIFYNRHPGPGPA
ncbi:hypothetical protein K439DRAFT_392266 [Ramaria rubella]|nr:hypothetical protein K439DRAFT_392266 [Ramaria rubella]